MRIVVLLTPFDWDSHIVERDYAAVADGIDCEKIDVVLATAGDAQLEVFLFIYLSDLLMCACK
jgi:hypothetical protein